MLNVIMLGVVALRSFPALSNICEFCFEKEKYVWKFEKKCFSCYAVNYDTNLFVTLTPSFRAELLEMGTHRQAAGQAPAGRRTPADKQKRRNKNKLKNLAENLIIPYFTLNSTWSNAIKLHTV